MVRVRFAPSPTGFLHLGSARTFIFNWLYARWNGGALVIRIDDTGVGRNREELLVSNCNGLIRRCMSGSRIADAKRAALTGQSLGPTCSPRSARAA